MGERGRVRLRCRMPPALGKASSGVRGSRAFISELVAAGLALSACDPSGLQDNADALLKPARSRFDTPGVQIAPGDFASVELVGDTAGVITFSSRRQFDDGEHLLLINVDWGAVLTGTKTPEQATEVCDAGPFSSLRWSGSSVSSSIDTVTAWMFLDSDGDGLGTLKFQGRDCTERLPPIQGFRFDSIVSASQDDVWTTLGLDDGGTVYDLKPAEGGAQPVLTNVEKMFLSPNEAFIWLVEAGKLVARRLPGLRVVAGWGNGVIDATYDGGSAYFSDKDGLFRLSFQGGEPVKIAAEGCQAFGAGPYVLYFSPCESKRLNVVKLSQSAEGPLIVDGPVLGPVLDAPVVSAHAQSLVPFGEDYVPGTPKYYLSLITSSKDKGQGNVVGKLYVAEVSDPLAASSELNLTQIDERAKMDENGIYLRWSGVAGDFYPFPARPDEADGTWWQDAPRFSGLVTPSAAQVFLTDFNGKTVRLVRTDGATFRASEDSELARDILYDGKPSQPRPPGQWELRLFRLDPEDQNSVQGAVFVTEDGPGEGGALRTLTIEEGSRLSEPLAQRVLGGSVEVLTVISAFAYLTADKERALNVYLRGNGLTQRFAAHVSTYFEIFMPSAGLIYVVDSGKDQGIWFARAR